MQLPSWLAPLAGVAGQAAQGNAVDQQTAAQRALLQRTAQREDERDRVLNALSEAQRQQALAHANLFNNPQVGLTYKTDENGNIVALPTKTTASATQPTQSTDSSVTPSPVAPTVTPITTGVKAPVKPTSAPKTITTDNGIYQWDPTAKTWTDTGQKPPKKQEPLKPVVQADGTTAYVPASQAVGKQAPGGKGGGGALGVGAGGIGGLARQAGGIVGVEQADQRMQPYENAARNKQVSYDGLDYFVGRLGSMYDVHGNSLHINEAEQSAALATLNKRNPQLANYLRNAMQWALEDASLSGRASDFRTKMDEFVSAIGPDASPEQIDQVQQFRALRVAELKKFQPAMEAIATRIAGGAPGAAKSPQGAPSPGGPAAAKAPNATQLARAAKDPLYKQFLQSSGYTLP